MPTNKYIFKFAIILILLNLLILTVLILMLHPSWEIGSDGYGYYIYLRSLFFDHNFNFYNEYKQFDDFYGTWMGPRITPASHIGNLFSIGPSLAWTPFFLIGHSMQNLFNFPDNYHQLSGFNWPYQAAISIGSIFYFVLGLLFLFLSLCKLFNEKISFWITSSIWLISPLIFYVVYEPSMSHAISFFAITGLFYFFLKYYLPKQQLKPKNIIFLGFWIGIASLIRWQNVSFIILPLFLIYFQNNALLKKVKQTVILFFTIILVFTPQLLMWHYLYGSFLVAPQGSKFFNLLTPHLWQLLFSGYHGLFIWQPLLLLGLIGLIIYYKKNRTLAFILTIALAFQIYINSALTDWMAGGSFGARRLDNSFFIFAIGLAEISSRLSKKKILTVILAGLIIIGIAWNILLMVATARGILPLNQSVTIFQVYTAPLKLLAQLKFN
jgi:hypothetical protein